MRNRPVRLLLAGLVAATILAGCGSKKDNRNATTNKVTTTTAAADATVDSAAGPSSGSQTTAANNLQNSSKSPTTAKASGSISAAGNTTSPPPAAAAGLQPTAPGKYTYHLTGNGGGQNIDQQLTMTVDPPTGADQHSSTQTQQGTTEQYLRYQASGLYLVELKLNAGFIQKDFKPNPPALQYPEPAPVGKSWSWQVTSSDGKTTVNTAFTVLRTENVTIGGETVPTTVLKVTITTSGDIASKSDSTYWVSEKYRLIVKQDATTDITSPIVSHSQTSQTLNSTKPS
ncbi:MAG: hypothetical protein JO054_00215 [Actinobacteria bacterium]|nr:hypothetical protein [Actinomycetota bacterium]